MWILPETASEGNRYQVIIKILENDTLIIPREFRSKLLVQGAAVMFDIAQISLILVKFGTIQRCFRMVPKPPKSEQY